MNLETHITFDDVLLVPQYSDIKSRTEVTLTSEMSEGVELRVPIISAPFVVV
jgi:IMP dehydrogenase/GMP reductase